MKLPFRMRGRKLLKTTYHLATHLYRTRRVLFIAGCTTTLLLVSGSCFALWRAGSTKQNSAKLQSVQSSNNTGSHEGTDQTAAASSTPAPSGATDAQNLSAPSQKPGSNTSASSPTGARGMSPYDNCPAAYHPPKNYGPGGFTSPPPVIKTMPAKTVTIPYGKTSGSFSFTSPDNVALGFTSYLGAPGSGASAQIVSGYMTPTVTISVKPGTSDGFTQYLNIGSVCYQYQMPLYFNYEPAPALNFNIAYNEAANAISFTASGKITTINLSYTINGCNPAAGSLCYGYDSVVANASSGQINLDPLFPEIDAYFAQYDANGVTLTLNPAAPGYQPNSAYVTFSLE